jgi:predicted metal-binding membrane protein
MKTASAGTDLLDTALRRDRTLVLIGLALLATLAWGYVIAMGRMTSPEALMTMPMPANAGVPALRFLIPMWIVMMVAMMIPSAAPMILLFTGLVRRRQAEGIPTTSAAVFTLGYLLVWSAYATVAAVAQWKLHQLALLSPAMASASPWLGGGLLILAGLYQWLPVKGTCLSHCRSPVNFISSHWREGGVGALLMGVEHGSYCVGCCWALMALLFVAGVMNLLWVAAIAILVLLEKVVPGGRELGRGAGFLLIVWGIWVLAAGP